MARVAAHRAVMAVGLALAGLVTLAVSPVSADRLGYSLMSFQVCVGSTTTKSDQFPMLRTDVGATYANGHAARFRILFIEQPANGHMSASITDSSLTLPSDWQSKPLDSTSTDKMSISVTFEATKQFTDGGRIRMLIDGNLESIDVPTFVSCPAAAVPDSDPPYLLAAASSSSGPIVPLAIIVSGGVLGVLVAAGIEALARRRNRELPGRSRPVRTIVALLLGLLLATPLALTLPSAPTGSAGPGETPGASGPVAQGSAGPVTPGPSGDLPPSGEPSPGGSGALGPSGPPPSGGPSSAPTAKPPAGPTAGPTAAPPALTAATDLYFPMDAEETATGQLVLDPLLNDVGPNPGAITITAVTQLTIPAHYIHSGDSGTAAVGTLSITSDGHRLRWVDTVCRTVTSLCYNLPPLRFTYTIADGSKTDTGVGWLKFDRPWLIPFDFDRTTLVVPAAAAAYIQVEIPLPVLDANDLSIDGLPGVALTLLEPCPDTPTELCVITAKAVTSGPIAFALKPIGGTEINAVVEFGAAVDAGGGNIAVTGMADFGTTGLCATVPFAFEGVTYQIRTGCWNTSGTLPVSVTGGPEAAQYPPLMNTFGVYIANLSVPVQCPGASGCP